MSHQNVNTHIIIDQTIKKLGQTIVKNYALQQPIRMPKFTKDQFIQLLEVLKKERKEPPMHNGSIGGDENAVNFQ